MAVKLFFLLSMCAAAMWFLLLLIRRFRQIDLHETVRFNDRKWLQK
jgi:hypothetical protein